MKHFQIMTLLTIFLCATHWETANAYDDDTVHPRINLESSKSSPQLKAFLEGLGFIEGIEKRVHAK